MIKNKGTKSAKKCHLKFDENYKYSKCNTESSAIAQNRVFYVYVPRNFSSVSDVFCT